MNTSSLTSTNPPTAVRIPRATSANLTIPLQLREPPGRIVKPCRVGRRSGKAGDQARGRIPGVAKFLPLGGKLRSGVVGNSLRIDFADAPPGPQPRHGGPFGDDRMRALESTQLLVGGGAATPEQKAKHGRASHAVS